MKMGAENADQGKQTLRGYIDSCRLKGFSRQEIIETLKASGYDEEIIGLAYDAHHFRRLNLVSAAICGVLLMVIVALVGFPSMWVDPSRLLTSSQQAIGLVANPLVCLDISSPAGRQGCMERVRADLVAVTRRSVAPSDPAYSSYAQNTIFLAAVRRDVSLCRSLDPRWIAPCASTFSYVRANIEGDPALCRDIADQVGREQCAIESLGRSDPVGSRRLQANIQGAVEEGVSQEDSTKCSSIPYEFLRQDCEQSVRARIAVKRGSASR